MKPAQIETRILDNGGDTVYAVGFGGIWLTLEVLSSGTPCCVDLHAPFAIADTDPYSLHEFLKDGEPDHDCRLLSGPCWTVTYRGYEGSKGMVLEVGKPGELDYDAAALHNLSQVIREAADDAEVMRVSWRVRLVRRAVRWAVPR